MASGVDAASLQREILAMIEDAGESVSELRDLLLAMKREKERRRRSPRSLRG